MMEHAKFAKHSQPVMFEYVRGATPDRDRYRAVDVELNWVMPVSLPVDMADADPMMAQNSLRVGMASGGAANDAAINAFRAGASVENAIALAKELTYDAGIVEDDKAEVTAYTVAGASAGILHRAGLSTEVATETAGCVVEMARAIAAEHTDEESMTGEVRRRPTPELMSPDASVVRQFHALRRTYQDATTRFADMKERLLAMDRGAFGPDISGITGAARQLFVDKGYKQNQLATLADNIAQRHMVELSKAVEAAEVGFQRAEQSVAVTELEVQKLVAAETSRRHSAVVKAEMNLASNRSRPALAAFGIASTALTNAENDKKVAALGARKQRLAAGVRALVAANKAAPEEWNIAQIAARAACETFRKPGDEERSRLAAATAHIALLGGASESDAMVAAHLFATNYDNFLPVEDEDLHATQVVYAQVASSSGSYPADPLKQRTQMLAAAAAIDTLARPDVNHKAVAQLFGKFVVGAKSPAAAPKLRAAVFVSGETPAKELEKPPKLSVIPENYAPVVSPYDGNRAVPVRGWEHAGLRQIEIPGVEGEKETKNIYLIETKAHEGLGTVWTEFDWAGNVNLGYGEITVRPRDAKPGDTAGHRKVLVPYNGFSQQWETFEQRARDIREKAEAVMAENDHLIESRDNNWGLTRVPYHGKKSRYLDNVLPQFQEKMQQEIMLVARGRRTLPAFKAAMADAIISLSDKLEGDRNRKKAILRYQVDTIVRGIATVAGVAIPVGRVGIAATALHH